MKQKKAMLIMVIVLAVLLALYGGLKAWNGHSEKQKKAKEDKEKVSLVDVKSLKSFAYESGGSKMSFTKNDGEWVYDEDDGVRLNQSTIKSTAKEITGLTAVRKLSDPDEKADYGLDSSDYTVTYTAKDGTKGTIEIGDAAGDNYYAMIQDSDAVYTISSTLVSDLVFDLSSLTENDTLPSISSGNLLHKMERPRLIRKRSNAVNLPVAGEPSRLPSVQTIMSKILQNMVWMKQTGSR